MKTALVVALIVHLAAFLFFRGRITAKVSSLTFSPITVEPYRPGQPESKGTAKRIDGFLENTSRPMPASGSTDVVSEAKGDVQLPEIIYPEEAKKNHVEGVGKALVFFDDKGKVTKVDVVASTGSLLLDRSIEKSFSNWIEGRFANQSVTIPVNFKLD